MPVKVRCRGCQKVLNAPDKARGKVIKCPQCGEKIKVPEGGEAAARAPKPTGPRDGDDFLSGLNVNQLEAEHGEEKVCPYCAADMPDPEDPVCRKCGMNIETGQMDVKEAKKRSRKGPDPALFYSLAWTDSWEYLQRYWRLAVRTGLIWTAFLTVAWSSPFLTWMWVLEPALHAPAEPAAMGHGHGAEEPQEPENPYLSPGFLFFVGMGFVFSLGVPGWYWALSLKIIDATMQKEDIKEDRIQFDMFEAIAMGLRTYFWPMILMLPLLPLWAVIVALVGGGLDVLTGGSALIVGPAVVALILAYAFFPYLVFPQALVHMSVRHRFKAWILWDQLVVLCKNFGATLYWWLVAFCVFLPTIVLLTLFILYAGDVILWYFAKMDGAGAWLYGFIMDVGQPESRGIFFKILQTFLIFGMIAPLAAVYAFLLAFPALFMMRANGLYGYYRRETLELVTHVKPNQLAGFWVRFLTHSIDYAVIGFFLALMFALPNLLVAAKFPLGTYFGAGLMAAINVGFVAIAGAKNPQISMGSLLLGVVSAMTFMYSEAIPVFAQLQTFMPLVMWLYNSWMHFTVNEASTSRSTIGKEGFGLIVQSAEKGAELTMQQASTRHLGRILCDITCGIGYTVAGFHPKKQALHDLMAKSVVVFRGDN